VTSHSRKNAKAKNLKINAGTKCNLPALIIQHRLRLLTAVGAGSASTFGLAL